MELTPDLAELFESWVFLTPRQKAAVLALMRAFAVYEKTESRSQKQNDFCKRAGELP